mgnify:CR=1 FL=1
MKFPLPAKCLRYAKIFREGKELLNRRFYEEKLRLYPLDGGIAGHETALKERMKSNTGKYRILEETLLSVELGVAFKIGGGEELAALISKALVVMRNDGFTASVLKRYGVNPDDVMTGEV